MPRQGRLCPKRKLALFITDAVLPVVGFSGAGDVLFISFLRRCFFFFFFRDWPLHVRF